jgi:hypothetical protein
MRTDIALTLALSRESKRWQNAVMSSLHDHDVLWRKWPRSEDWPGVLNLYEAAAYRRVSYLTIWRLCQKGRDGRARLAHQRIGSVYRISRAALDRFGLTPGREVGV